MSKPRYTLSPASHAEVIPPTEWPGIDPLKRVTFGRLLSVAAVELALPEDYARQADLERARPSVLTNGLYVMRSHANYHKAELRHEDVAFAPDEYAAVARSPVDLAQKTMARTRASNIANADRDAVTAKVRRSAGHALEGKKKELEALQGRLFARRLLLNSLRADLRSPWQAHYKAGNLDAHRASVDAVIHEKAEVAAITQGWSSVAIEGMHKAIKYHVYSGNTKFGTQRYRVGEYLKLVSRHTQAKEQVVQHSKRRVLQQLKEYEADLAGALF